MRQSSKSKQKFVILTNSRTASEYLARLLNKRPSVFLPGYSFERASGFVKGEDAAARRVILTDIRMKGERRDCIEAPLFISFFRFPTHGRLCFRPVAKLQELRHEKCFPPGLFGITTEISQLKRSTQTAAGVIFDLLSLLSPTAKESRPKANFRRWQS